jgi:U6 snRNA-associated Sm-like protein LSm4
MEQIKYLRVPDQLLDVVKDEQARAREAGRSTRGAGPGRGGIISLSRRPFGLLSSGRGGPPQRGGRGMPRGGPPRGGRGRGRGM